MCEHLQRIESYFLWDAESCLSDIVAALPVESFRAGSSLLCHTSRPVMFIMEKTTTNAPIIVSTDVC